MSHFITTLALEIYLLQLQTKNATVIAMMYMYQHENTTHSDNGKQASKRWE